MTGTWRSPGVRPETVSRVCLDSSCLIGVVQGEEAFAPLRSLLAQIASGRVELVASTALLAEFLPNHSRSDRDLTSQVRGLVKSQATLVDVTPSLAELAADLREEFGLKTWDAIHLATSVMTEADVLFVRDEKFPTGRLVRGPGRVPLTTSKGSTSSTATSIRKTSNPLITRLFAERPGAP